MVSSDANDVHEVLPADTNWSSLAQLMVKPRHLADVIENVRFVGVVQTISLAKRRLLRQNRLVAIQTAHVADPTKQFFKITSWQTFPSVRIEDNSKNTSKGVTINSMDDAQLRPDNSADYGHQHASRETVVRVGDLILFENCRLRSFRGAIEAQVTKQTRLTLLYREDHFFGTPRIRLNQVYSLIQWLQNHQQELLIANASFNNAPKCQNLKDLRENMLVTVVCHIRQTSQQQEALADECTVIGGQDTCLEWAMEELVMVDVATSHCVPLYCFDQHADPQFISRLMKNALTARYEVSHLLIQLNSFANRLVAHTTAQTVFRALLSDQKHSLLSSEAVEVACFDDLLELHDHSAVVVLDNVRVVQMRWDVDLGSTDEILASHVPRLVESFCTKCMETLPTKPIETIPTLYGSCRNRCRTGQSEAAHDWRFRSFEMTLQDTNDQQLQVRVTNDALEELLGNIKAQMVVFPNGSATSAAAAAAAPAATDPKSCCLPVCINEVIASHLNALTSDDDSQSFRVEIQLDRTKALSSRVIGDSILDESNMGDESVSVSEPIGIQDLLRGSLIRLW